MHRDLKIFCLDASFRDFDMIAPSNFHESEGKINLRKLYPISHLWPFMRSVSWLLAFVFCLIIVAFADYYWASEIERDLERDLVHFVMAMLLAISFLGWVMRFLLYELEMWHYDYRVEKGHLNIHKGIFLKQKGSFPLARITDIYLDRSFSDFVFGLWNVHVSTPTASSGVFARVNGLSELNATGLQRSLSELVQASTIDMEDLGNNVAHRNLESFRTLMQTHKKQPATSDIKSSEASQQHSQVSRAATHSSARDSEIA